MMKFEYRPYDAPTLVCPDPNANVANGGGGGFSIWSYMTAAVVWIKNFAWPRPKMVFL